MSSINTWSTAAASNNQAVPNGAPEGWFGGDVNAWGRETMAAVRTLWERDLWRDVTMQTTGSRYTLVRDSDTQVTIQSVDLTSVLVAGDRIRVMNSVSAVIYADITTSTYSGGHTVLVITPDEGDADGTSLLTTGNISFATNVITRTSGSWVTDGFVTGDRLRIAGHATNNGYYVVSSVVALTMTLTPVASAGYVVNDASAAAGNCYRISSVGVLPAAPLQQVDVCGAHTDQERLQDLGGFNPLSFVTHEKLGDAAYGRESELVVAEAANALALNGDTQGAGNGIDADTVDGSHLTDILGLSGGLFQPVTGDTSGVWTVWTPVTGLTGVTVPGTPDSVETYLLTFRILMLITDNAAGNLQLRAYLGPLGTIADPVLFTTSAESVSSASGQNARFDYDFETIPDSGDKLTVALYGAGTAYDVKAHPTSSPQIDHGSMTERQGPGSFIRMQRVST
jgi:hypothetical protein